MPSGIKKKLTKRSSSFVRSHLDLLVRYIQLRNIERLSTTEAHAKIAEENGFTISAIRSKSHTGNWESKANSLLPATQACIPTPTTDHSVIASQREKMLESSNAQLEQWKENMRYLQNQFRIASKMKNESKALRIINALNANALYLIRTQQVSSYATCDSGSSVASGEAGSPSLTNPITIFLSKEIAMPRIAQPRPEPQTIELRRINAFPEIENKS